VDADGQDPFDIGGAARAGGQGEIGLLAAKEFLHARGEGGEIGDDGPFMQYDRVDGCQGGGRSPLRIGQVEEKTAGGRDAGGGVADCQPGRGLGCNVGAGEGGNYPLQCLRYPGDRDRFAVGELCQVFGVLLMRRAAGDDCADSFGCGDEIIDH